MYKYEMHLHTSPVSKCARASVEENLKFYAEQGYDGVFITNHFLDGNINIEASRPYAEKMAYYVSDYEEACRTAGLYGLKVFFGIETTYGGTDFLVYGLDPEWYFAHPEIMEMEKTAELPYLAEAGALVLQAHPFREADYIDHIRLYPRSVEGIETYNACRTDLENRMAEIYAEQYDLKRLAGTDNHRGPGQEKLAGVMTETPIESVEDFIRRFRRGELKLFRADKIGEEWKEQEL